MLIVSRASVEAEQAHGKTPLHLAAERGFVDVVQELIKAGASVAVQDGSGRSPLSVAVATNRDEIVKLLLAHGAPVNVKDVQGTTPLMEAAKHGRLELAKLLVKSGAAVDETQRFGRSALMLALSHRQQWIVQWLLKDCGASVATADSAGLDGKTPLDLAVEKGFVDEFRPLRTRGGGDDARLDATLLFMTAAKFGRVGLMNMLRQMGTTLHREGVEGSTRDLDGNTTALLSLARWGRVGYFKRLFASCIEHASDTPDVSNGSAALLRDTLKAIRDLCADIEESEHMYSSVVARLADVGATCMEALREDGNNRMMLADIVYRFCRQLLQCRKLSAITRFLESHTTTSSLRDFHGEIDMLERDAQQGALRDVDQAEAMTNLKYMATKRVRREAADIAIAQSVIDQLQSSGASVPDIPSWFLSRYNFCQIATAWKQISHQNVVDLFGACHVGLPRFFVCASLRDECLKPFLNRHHSRLLALTKLDEAAQGLLFLHERGVYFIEEAEVDARAKAQTKSGRAKIGMLETAKLAQHIHSRLTEVFKVLAREKLAPTDKIVAQFVDVLDGFRCYLKPGVQALSHTMRAKSQKI
ncbi:hypothetical protein PybrP1_008882, partial [[Pythium] brassicae (nom. inval.)]